MRDLDPPAPPEALGREICVSSGKFHRLVQLIGSVINGTTAGEETLETGEISALAEGLSTLNKIDALF